MGIYVVKTTADLPTEKDRLDHLEKLYPNIKDDVIIETSYGDFKYKQVKIWVKNEN